MITYRATLDVPASTVSQVARWLSAYRKLHDRRPWQRAATPFVQAVMVLRWFKNATDLPTLARDGRVSIATAYRYLHEAIDVIAAHAPDLPEVLAHGLQQGWTFCCLHGTLIPSVRSAAPSEAGHDVWYSGKHHRHGGNIQVLTGQPATRNGSATWNPAPLTTSPPRVSTPYRRCIRPPQPGCRP